MLNCSTFVVVRTLNTSCIGLGTCRHRSSLLHSSLPRSSPITRYRSRESSPKFIATLTEPARSGYSRFSLEKRQLTLFARFAPCPCPQLNILASNRSRFTFKSTSSAAKDMYASQAPCALGDLTKDVETPGLIVCMDKLENNLKKLTEFMKQYPGVVARPHSKSHKCAAIARMQIEAGHVGLCCQTITEAEAMVGGGLKDIFIPNQVIGRKKILRLVNLARCAKISVCVDHESNIVEISNAACDTGMTLDLVIEVDVGQDRCGIKPGDVPRLAKLIVSSPNVNFKGLHCYNGANQHIRDWKDKKAAVDLVTEKVKIALQALKEHGIECNYVTGGGTGTFHFEAQSGVFTEVQPGSYIFMDADYNRNLDKSGDEVPEFEQSLYLLTTVQSVTPGDKVVLDAGLKAVSMDSGVPVVTGVEKDSIFYNAGDEHGVVRPCGDLQLGQQVWLIPGHCDPTVNMHDWLVGLRDGKVENIWKVTGRGPGI